MSPYEALTSLSFGKLILRTCRTILWKSDSLFSKTFVFWKLFVQLDNLKSRQKSSFGFLKHVLFSRSRFLGLYTLRKFCIFCFSCSTSKSSYQIILPYHATKLSCVATITVKWFEMFFFFFFFLGGGGGDNRDHQKVIFYL